MPTCAQAGLQAYSMIYMILGTGSMCYMASDRVPTPEGAHPSCLARFTRELCDVGAEVPEMSDVCSRSQAGQRTLNYAPLGRALATRITCRPHGLRAKSSFKMQDCFQTPGLDEDPQL